jgi:hypothetical protein
MQLPTPTPQLLAHCPLCQAAYQEAGVRLLGEFGAISGLRLPDGQVTAPGKSRLFHLTCPNCCHAVLAVILESVHGISSIGLVTDLEAQDAARFQSAALISSDDVVTAHRDLEGKSQEICKVLLGAV